MKTNKKGSILMITLWILAILVIFALGLGHRAAINLRLVKYQRDRLKATFLAKAGINRAIAELENDLKKDQDNPPPYDGLDETWSTGVDDKNNPIFENIEIKEGAGETFTVSIKDEQAKININRIDIIGQKQVLEIFRFAGLEESEVEKLKNIVVDWIDTGPVTEPEKENFKNQPLKTPEELLLILEYFYKNNGIENFQEKAQEVFSAIKDLITVYSQGSVNINSVSEDVLTILANSVANDPSERDCVAPVVNEVLRQREEKKYFTTLNDIISDDLIGGTTSDIDLFNNGLKPNLIVTSNYFKIEAKGYSGKVTKKITAIYDRQNKKIVSWHEN